jgi:malate dehydrogenase
LQGEYGIEGLFVGVPVKLGAGGVRQIIPLSLTNEELAALKKSASAVQDLVEAMKRLSAESEPNA